MLSESHSNKLLGILLLLLHIDVLQVECQQGFINFPVSNSEGMMPHYKHLSSQGVKVESVLNIVFRIFEDAMQSILHARTNPSHLHLL